MADISTFEMEGSYDRIYSIEMFEVNFFPTILEKKNLMDVIPHQPIIRINICVYACTE